MSIKKALNRLSLEQLEYLAFLMQILKDWLVVFCMAATLASGCRLEHTAAKYDAQIVELKQAAIEFKECAAKVDKDDDVISD